MALTLAVLPLGPVARAEASGIERSQRCVGPTPVQWLEDEERGYTPPLPPPPALPQQLNGVIRAPREGEAGRPERIERIRDVFTTMRQCWQVPRLPGGPTGQQMTLRISFKRDGQVLGRPQVTYYQAGGDSTAQEAFRRSVLLALQRCTPLAVSDSLGSAIAGRPFTFRFVDDRAL